VSADLRREFQALFDAEFSYVCRALRRLGVREGDLEDVAQEVFVSVHGKFASYDRALPIKPWLFAFAFRAAANYQRLARHRREVAAPDTHERAAEGTPEQLLVERQMQARVLAALEGVPLDRRSVLIMHDIDGISAPDISVALSIPLNTVYSRVRVAREEFRGALRREQLRGGER
jgi:RNA polymerase sigma-70 factor (ECF subfamily)